MNARARREAIRQMDAGNYAQAQAALVSASHATMTAAQYAPAASAPLYAKESAQLDELENSLRDRAQDKMSRKRLAYQDYARRHGKERK